MGDSIDAKIAQARKEAEKLKEQISKARYDADDTSFESVLQESKVGKVEAVQPKTNRFLRGHFGKVYAVVWGQDSEHLVSASQDGKLLVWNGLSTNKEHAVPLASAWVMTCGYSPGMTLVASGGLDNVCSIHRLRLREPAVNVAQLISHQGYLSGCVFQSDVRILTCSGDASCIQWDIEKTKPLQSFTAHSGDVMSLAVNPKNTDVFATGACDLSVKLWDARQHAAPLTSFNSAHGADINNVCFMSNGYAVASCGDDGDAKVYDVRSMKELREMKGSGVAATSVSFSLSGRFLFVGLENGNFAVWDTLLATQISSVVAHEEKLSCLAVSPDGRALCTGSWNPFLKIWAC